MFDQTKNKLHQTIWLNRRGKYAPNGKLSTSLDPFHNMFMKQYEQSQWFGHVDLFWFGDSNAEYARNYSTMKLFPKLTLNMGVGSTRVDHWLNYFRSNKGVELLSKIGNSKVLFNLGGNNVLQGRDLEWSKEEYLQLGKLFPNAYHITIPAVWASSVLNMPETVDKIKSLNETIREVGGDRTIDVFNYTTINGIDPLPFVHDDMFHYTDKYDNVVRVPLILEKIYK